MVFQTIDGDNPKNQVVFSQNAYQRFLKSDGVFLQTKSI